MPLDHIAISIPANKLENMVQWLTVAGEPLGFKEFFRPMPTLVALGDEKPWFWVFGDEKLNDIEFNWRHPHIGLVAPDAETVNQWHCAAIKVGGTDNGKPGPRPRSGPNYYAAFVKDPVLDINFEAVCRNWSGPETLEEGQNTTATTNGRNAVAVGSKVAQKPAKGKERKFVNDDQVRIEADKVHKKRARRAT